MKAAAVGIDWDALLPPKPVEHIEKAGAGGTAEPEEPATDLGIAARERQGDNRRRCTECGNMGERGICLAAQRGEIVAARGYTPIRDLLRRCDGFAPLPTDPDETPGSVKWACLQDDSKLMDAPP